MVDDIASMETSELLDHVREAEQSDKNKRNRCLWNSEQEDSTETPGLPKAGETVPIAIEPEAPFWGDLFDFSLADFYTIPEVYLRRALQMMLYKFERWDENTIVERKIDLWMGVSLEPSLFGMKTVYRDRACPWIEETPIVEEPTDLNDLAQPDFQSSGIMPTVHKMYGGLQELVPEDFSVTFPRWERSPFGVCNYLRGTQNILMDLVQNPDLVRDMIRFVTNSREQWIGDRACSLGEDIQPGVLLNDEVNGDMFQADLYKNYILPSEKELDEFQGIWYWHSCGNVTEFLEHIREIRGIKMFHVSPWTKLKRAADIMGDKVLQICLDPLKDVQRATPQHIEKHVDNIFSTCQGKAFTIRADGIHNVDSVKRELKAVDKWLSIARDVRGRYE